VPARGGREMYRSPNITAVYTANIHYNYIVNPETEAVTDISIIASDHLACILRPSLFKPFSDSAFISTSRLQRTDGNMSLNGQYINV